MEKAVAGGGSKVPSNANDFLHPGFAAIFYNQSLISAFLSCVIAQALKVVTTWYSPSDFR